MVSQARSKSKRNRESCIRRRQRSKSLGLVDLLLLVVALSQATVLCFHSQRFCLDPGFQVAAKLERGKPEQASEHVAETALVVGL